MKRWWNLGFAPKGILVLLLCSILLGVSIAYAEEQQSESGQKQTLRYVEELNIDKAYAAWMLAVRYRFEETAEGYEVAHDPSIMKEIASLRGDDLRYFMDFIEAINQVQTTLFLPSSPDVRPTKGITVSEERKLVEIVIANVFSTGEETTDLTGLRERDQRYISQLQTILNAIAKGNGDTFFTEKYLRYRTDIIQFIEDTNTELFNPSQKAVDSYLQYFGIEDVQSVDLNPNGGLRADCSTTNTTDNWPSKSSTYSGSTGSSWYEGMESSQTDCDIWVRYYMGPAPHYGQISAGTSSAQCVLDKTSQLAADWSGSMIYNYVQYGKTRVTWWWPFGCNTTGSALMSATKWRP